MIWVDPPYSPLNFFTSYLRPIHLTIWPIPFSLEKKRILQTTFDSQPRPFQCQHQRRVNGTWGASTCVLLPPCVNDAPSGKKMIFCFLPWTSSFIVNRSEKPRLSSLACVYGHHDKNKDDEFNSSRPTYLFVRILMDMDECRENSSISFSLKKISNFWIYVSVHFFPQLLKKFNRLCLTGNPKFPLYKQPSSSLVLGFSLDELRFFSLFFFYAQIERIFVSKN